MESKHVTNVANVETYLDRLIKGVKEELKTISTKILVDLIGKLDKISKKAKIFVDDTKKGLPLEVGEEFYGEITKIRKSEVQKWSYDTEEVYNAMELRDFFRVAKIEAKALSVFIKDKDEIKKLRHDAGTTERFIIEDIK